MTSQDNSKKVEQLTRNIIDLLNDKELTPILRTHLEATPEVSIPFLYQTHYADKDEHAAYEYLKRKSYLRTKQRWATTAIQNYQSGKRPDKELTRKAKYLQSYIEQFGIEGFKREFKTKNLTEYMELSEKELLAWSYNDEMPLFTYPFFEEKTKKQRNNAIQIDLAVMIGDFLIKRKLSITPQAYHTPNIALTTPFFGTSSKGRLSVQEQEVLKLDGEGMDVGGFFHKAGQQNKFGTSENIQMLVSANFASEFNKSVPDLDTKDFECFLEILNFRDKKFEATRIINFTLRDMVKKLYKSDNSKNYKATLERLMKLNSVRAAKVNESGGYTIRALFPELEIKDDTTGTGDILITAHASNTLYEELIQQQVVSIYSDKVLELKGTFAYHLVFVLQRERRIANQMQEPNPVRRNWLDFRYAVRFNRKTKRENLQELDNALTEIKNRNFVIEDFYRHGEFYFFSFYPLSDLELTEFGMTHLE